MIRWITKNLGTCAYSKLPSELNATIIDVRDLVDKSGNPQDYVKKKIDLAVTAINEGNRVVICCDYGISRSNAIAAGVLALTSKISFEQAVQDVVENTNEQSIKIEMINTVRSALSTTPALSTTHTNNSVPGILVTGTTGYLGEHFTKRKDSKYLSISKHDFDLVNDTAELDLYIQRNKISTIVHFANPRIWNTNKAFGETLIILRNILDICREHNIRLIYPSHTNIFSGYNIDKLTATEDTPVQPKGLLGETKYLCESLIKLYNDQYGINSVIVRSPNIYGRSLIKPRFINEYIRKALNNESIITHTYRNGPPEIELLYIDDYLSAIDKVVESHCPEILHLGTDKLITTHEIAVNICKQLDSAVKITSINIDDLAPKITTDYSLASKELMWKPTVDITQGLHELINQHKIKTNLTASGEM